MVWSLRGLLLSGATARGFLLPRVAADGLGEPVADAVQTFSNRSLSDAQELGGLGLSISGDTVRDDKTVGAVLASAVNQVGEHRGGFGAVQMGGGGARFGVDDGAGLAGLGVGVLSDCPRVPMLGAVLSLGGVLNGSAHYLAERPVGLGFSDERFGHRDVGGMSDGPKLFGYVELAVSEPLKDGRDSLSGLLIDSAVVGAVFVAGHLQEIVVLLFAAVGCPDFKSGFPALGVGNFESGGECCAVVKLGFLADDVAGHHVGAGHDCFHLGCGLHGKILHLINL